MLTTTKTPDRALLRASGPDAYILALITSFPCLEHKIRHPFAVRMFFPEGKFKIDRWMDSIGAWSHGERLCALFVANVWCPGYAESNGWRFDIFEALGTWDEENRYAFLKWIVDPVWP